MFVTKIVIKTKHINCITIEDSDLNIINVDSKQTQLEDYYIMKFYIKFEPHCSQTIKIKWNYNSEQYFENIYIDENNYKYKYVYELIQSYNEYDDFIIKEL
jgi:hypothetical protein